MIDAVKKFIKNYADFKGRTNRPDYWWVFLAIVICEVILGVLCAVFSAIHVGFIGTILSVVFELAILVPWLAITVRRLRDVGKKWRNHSYNCFSKTVTSLINEKLVGLSRLFLCIVIAYFYGKW